MVKSRNYTLDLVKLICAFGVISIHIPSNTPAADYIGGFFHPFCVPFFYVASLTYFIKGLANVPLDKQLLRIWYRLVVPLLSWTTIYVILMIVKKLLTKEQPNLNLLDAYFYGQSAVQLYYLPSLILMQLYTLAGYLLKNNTRTQKLNGLILLAICIVYHIVAYQHNCFGKETFITYPIFIVLGLLMYSQLKKQVFLKKGFFALGFVICIVALLINFNMVPINSVLVFPFSPNLIFPVAFLVFPIGGLGLFLITIYLPSVKVTNTSIKVISASYGIYLSHVLFLEAIQFFIAHFFHQQILYTFSIKLLMTFVIFITSLIFTLLTNKIFLLRFLLYGKNKIAKKL